MGAAMGCGSSASKPSTQGPPVQGILLDGDGDDVFVEGQQLRVDADGTLDMGDMDHVLGANSADVAALPTQTLSSAAMLTTTICNVCQESFAAGCTVKTLPCGHVFHQ